MDYVFLYHVLSHHHGMLQINDLIHELAAWEHLPQIRVRVMSHSDAEKACDWSFNLNWTGLWHSHLISSILVQSHCQHHDRCSKNQTFNLNFFHFIIIACQKIVFNLVLDWCLKEITIFRHEEVFYYHCQALNQIKFNLNSNRSDLGWH